MGWLHSGSITVQPGCRTHAEPLSPALSAHTALPAHCTLYTVHCTLPNAHCTRHTAHCTQLTVLSAHTALPAQCTLPNSLCTLHTPVCMCCAAVREGGCTFGGMIVMVWSSTRPRDKRDRRRPLHYGACHHTLHTLHTLHTAHCTLKTVNCILKNAY